MFAFAHRYRSQEIPFVWQIFKRKNIANNCSELVENKITKSVRERKMAQKIINNQKKSVEYIFFFISHIDSTITINNRTSARVRNVFSYLSIFRLHLICFLTNFIAAVSIVHAKKKHDNNSHSFIHLLCFLGTHKRRTLHVGRRHAKKKNIKTYEEKKHAHQIDNR